MSWPEERARFPVLEQFAYLNAGTFGPLSRATLDAMAELRRWEGKHGRGGKEYFESMLARRDVVRALLADQIRVPAEHVSITDSTTQGVHIVVSGLALGAGRRGRDDGRRALRAYRPARWRRARRSASRACATRRAADVFELVRAQVTPRTKLIAISAVSWIDGTVFPWHELREATNVPVLVDGAQSAGAIDVDAAGADFYTVSAQKWLCGPDATGALFVADPDALPPRLVAYPGASSLRHRGGDLGAEGGRASLRPDVHACDVARRARGGAPRPARRSLRARARADGALPRASDRRGLRRRDRAGAGDARDSFRYAGDTAAAASRVVRPRCRPRASFRGTGFLRASVGWWNDGSDLERLVEGLAAI